MRPRSNILFLLLAAHTLTMVVSCGTPDYLSEEDLKSYILDRDNNLIKEHTVRDVKSQVTYRPTDLLILQETGDVLVQDSVKLRKLRTKYQNYYYFILSLSKNNKEAEYEMKAGYEKFSEVIQTLSFRMANHVNLTTSSRDTIPVGDYIYPRTYGMAGASTLMFAFNKEKAKDQEWLQFNLKEFGLGIGNQNFRFRIEDLENTPKIDFKIKTNK